MKNAFNKGLSNAMGMGLFIFLLVVGLKSFATHNRAGEITYRSLGGLTYEATVITYTYTPSLADRPQLDLNWGDGTTTTIQRTQKVNLPNDISYNVYVGVHTYAGPGTFTLSVFDPNRNAGVINIPRSVHEPFYIESVIRISQFMGVNNSPVLLNPPLDLACVNKPFYHNPGAYDPDGDSLVFSLVPCRGTLGMPVAGYFLPYASQYISIDAHTGTLSWINPIMRGQFNIAILIEEYRNGYLIGSVLRDMQIIVETCFNDPPEITAIADTCIEAGTFLTFPVLASDPNNNQVTLSATGGPFLVSSPANFPTVTGSSSVTGTFQWHTSCNHVRRLPWTVLFKAIDNAQPIQLASFKTVQITVVSPAPENLISEPVGNSIFVRWDEVSCKNAIGYKLYRRVGSYPFTPGPCETGMPSYAGYDLIARLNSVSDTFYLDDNRGAGLTHGLDYCYRVHAFFADSSESYISNESCTSLLKNVAVITNVSIRNTDENTGSLDLYWSKPTVIDTVQHPGPYSYRIYGGVNSASLSLLESVYSLNDTTFVDTLINTTNNSWHYRVDLWNDTPGNIYLIGESSRASSVFLQTSPTDQRIVLNWSEYVPWLNLTYVIYRQNPLTNNFDSIGFSTGQTYIDSGLTNGITYCYRVKSIGTYYSDGFISPIINWSQIRCEVPIDNIAPCAPVLFVDYDCDRFLNNLFWTNPMHQCGDDDIALYEIYYAVTINSDFEKIALVSNPWDTFYVHMGIPTIAGCYIVTAVDSSGNRSLFSNKVCVDIDSCELYRLPNVFTPNGDGFNDYFEPFQPFSFVEKIDIQIFNRWGQVVYATQDPYIRWDGRNQRTGGESAEGPYFYVCHVYELRLNGISKRTISGSVSLYR